MRLKLIISLLLVSLGLQAQVTVDSQYYNRSKSSNIWDRVKGDSVMAPPAIKASKGKYPGSFIYNPHIKSFEVYDSITRRWYPILSILQDGLVSGGNVSWTGTGLEFYIAEAVYVVGGQLYFSNDTVVTLAAADPTDPRLDVIGLNSSGVFVLTGTPAADPAKPQVTPGIELELTSVLINAGATTPGNLTQEVIYDENTEWTTATSNITADADNASFNYRGSKSFEISSYTADTRSISFTRSSTIDLANYNLLTLYIRLNAAYATNATISLRFTYQSGFFTFNSSSVVTISSGSYNFLHTVSGAYQVIQIPLSAFTFGQPLQLTPASVMNKLTISFANAGAGMNIDYVNLQGGISIPSNGVTSFNGRSGNVIPQRADYWQWFGDTSYRRMDSVFWRKNGVETFQYIDSTGGGGITYHLINGANNLGSGAQVFKDTSSNKINMRSLTAGWGLDVTQNTNDNEYKVDSSQVATQTDVQNAYTQTLALSDSTGFELVKPNGLRDTILFISDEPDLTIYTKQQDTIALASFGAGSAAAGDTAAFSTSAIYGSFYNSGSDTLYITSFQIGLQGTSPSITTEVFYNDSLNVSAGATKLVNAGSAVTGIYGLTNVSSLDNRNIPPGNWVWVKTSVVTTKPTYFTLTLIGYKKRR